MNKIKAFTFLNTPESERHLLEYSPVEVSVILKEGIRELQEERDRCWELLGRPNKNNIKRYKGREYTQPNGELLSEYFDLGGQIRAAMDRLGEVQKTIAKLAGFDKHSMFMHTAKQILPDETYEKIRKYSAHRLKELQSKVEMK